MKRLISALITGVRFGLWRWHDRVKRWLRGRQHTQSIFSRIYERNLWGDAESASGSGSSTAATVTLRAELPVLLTRLGISHLLDAPCGDFAWMKELVARLGTYTGVDVVPGMVERNRAQYGTDTVRFVCADICVDDLPAAELVLCRDCFIHLPTAMIYAALRNFRRTGARYVLLTNCADVDPYFDIPVGSFRPIDFSRPPFSFPEPLAVIREVEVTGRQLVLWDLGTLPL